ncbi:MAG TPA: hypothetical protein GX707_16505 [Epulopiscium sp.]|nr:hypothetical protein [Candidatus Epulonipiscium sp.]
MNVGVIHPIESFWLYYGPNDQTQAIRDQMDVNYENLMQWLLYGTIDFDLISEALLPELCKKASIPLELGEMEYDTILIPDCRTLRSSTLERLESFVDQGGKVIFAGRVPKLVDAKPSNRAIKLAEKAKIIGFNRQEMLDSLKEERLIEIRKDSGKLSDNLFYQLRKDTDCKWLYICHVNRKRNQVDTPEPYRIQIKGQWKIEAYDTLSGRIYDLPAEYEKGETFLYYTMYPEDSLLVKLMPLEKDIVINRDKRINHQSFDRSKQKKIIDFTQPESFDLSEPNALLLDYASYQFNDGPIKAKEEILRLDNKIRRKLGYPLRRDAYAQPWRLPETGTPKDKVTLFYEFNSEIEVADVLLAMERPENAKITLNGQIVKSQARGYYVDSFIHTVSLPKINKGINKLTLEIPFARETNLENIYILGSFGVELKGRRADIVEFPKQLEFGDITRQRLPFYTGNLDYNFTFELEEEKELIISIPHFSSPVLEIFVNEESKGLMAFAPHMKNIGRYGKGEHRLKVRVYGNRFNGFGTLHNCDDEFMWYGPDSYRTVGSQWSESYGVRPVGILSRLELIEQESN